ncbi:uncharacterized protein LOC111398492 [Olea europaea var. sylvestris]|uniref:uncharacterized protein LOC111398492 n=1 Tax=Olea europaea var. sylvestris TaxID=158386 RepID=UPI000C1D0C84|nr:uncharacterized protein LOC111398492 [Olea europaea var. sylvestris]XP_022881181.1 uncharacterized protein LOC111398492 [Olea europaea var. sylvestris]XP_022881182.1 uncharacterized protein LOC111398492 [Olea europaea var. sylvestris]XP_022881184.1 uncharacterized protein LOC111398492 [Olea europaea var. sylvestris]
MSSVMSLNSERSTARWNFLNRSSRLSGRNVPPNVSSIDLGNRENKLVDNADIQQGRDPMVISEHVVGCTNDRNSPQNTISGTRLLKSLSARFSSTHFPAQLESNSSRASSTKGPFSPVRKMFHSFSKAKSRRSPLSSSNEPGNQTISEHVGLKHGKTTGKSVWHDFSNKSHHSEFNSYSEKKENCNSILQSNPARLHGILKLEIKHGVPLYEFSVKCPEDVYIAKTQKEENALTLVYTFYSLDNRSKNNASGWGSKDSNRESSMIGKMEVSCYLQTELKVAGAFENSMVTECVLCDIAHPRTNTSSQDASSSSPDVVKAQFISDEILSSSSKQSQESSQCDSLTNPLVGAKLHSELEIAAIIMEVPVKNRECLKLKGRDRADDEPLQNRKAATSDRASPGKISVVIPSGSHSLQSTETCSPSSLLDRWRRGGGCDCGGWDMACPLNIFGNGNIQIAGDHILIDNRHPLKLFVQGKNDNIPALTIRVIDDGQYAVDFHAQLSSLQAFSICVAILHTAEASIVVGQEPNIKKLQNDSLSEFSEKEIKNLIDSGTEEKKAKVNKKEEEVLPPFVLYPPFSPIARV